MDRRQFIGATGAAAFGCATLSRAIAQTSWTPPYALPAPGQVIPLVAAAGNTLRDVATAANGWGEYAGGIGTGGPIYNGFGFGAFAEDYSAAGAMVIAGTGGHHAGGMWGGFLFDFTTGQWISKANANGKAETRADPEVSTVDWSTGELKDRTGLVGQLPIPGHGYIWPFCPPKSIGGGTRGCYIKPCVAAGSDAGYDAARSFQFDLDTGVWTYASDNNINFDGKYLNPYTDGGGDWDPATSRYYTPQKGAYTGELRYLEKTAAAWTWNKVKCPSLRNARLHTVFVHGRELVIGYTDATWQRVDLDNPGAGASYLTMTNASLATGPYQRWHCYPVDGCWYALKGRANRSAITTWVGDGSPAGTLAADQFLLKIDPTTWTISQVPIAGGIVALWESRYAATPAHGNAFVYVPKLQCFAWFPRHDGAVQLIKPPADGSSGGDTQAPTVPANLRVATTTASSIAWAWDASSDSGGGTVAGYKVALYDGADTPLGGTFDAGNVLAYAVSGLAPGATYKLRVGAYDNAVPPNESLLCPAVAGITAVAVDIEAPTVPANLRVTATTASSIAWAWDGSDDNGGGVVAGYRVALFDSADSAIGPPVDVGNVLAYTASGLAPGTLYRLRVRAYDNASPANVSADCAAVAGATDAVPADSQPPTVPATLRVTDVTVSSLSWAWSASTDLGGGAVAGYRVALYDKDDLPLGGAVDVGNRLTHAADGLKANTAYRLRVSAYDDARPPNESAPSAAVEGVTLKKTPPGKGR